MATDSLSYSGINRAVSDFSGAKFCEELINLRPTTDGLVPVKPFTTKYANSPYYKIFVHHTTDGDKYIGVRKDATNFKVIVEVIGTPATLLFERTMTGSVSYEKTHKMNLYAENLFFAAAGNVILFSERAIDQYAPPMENVSFIWRDGAYREEEANVPELDVSVSHGSMVGIYQQIPHISHESSFGEVVSAVENGLNAIQQTNPHFCIGPIIIAIAMKTKDGNTFWTDKWILFDPIMTVRNASNTPYVDATTRPSSNYANFFAKYGYGFESGYTYAPFLDNVVGFGTEVTVSLGRLSSTASDPNYWNKNTSMIQSVEIYASRPFLSVDVNGAYDGLIDIGPTEPENDYRLVLPQAKYEDMDFENCILYHQASVSMEALAALGQGDVVPVKLSFGGNSQLTNETLRVDAGAVTRYGKLLSYNSRFHYYDSVSRTAIGMPDLQWGHPTTGSVATTYFIARYSDGNGSRLMRVNEWNLIFDEPADIVIAPSLNINELIVYSKANGGYKYWKYRMKASKSYNFSICNEGAYDDGDGQGTISEYEAVLNSGNVIENAEPASINVTEQYNPFVFRVEHSYLAPGNVIDVVPQQYVVTDATYGREPLDVFTTQGVYALIQGGGDILYSWFDPISPMIAEGPAAPTEMGIFFISGGSLWLCAGHRTTLVSDALSAGPHKYIRACTGYKKISGQDSSYSPSPSVSDPQYDVSDNLSQVEFEKFASGDPANSIGKGRLSYNRFRQELYVSNGSYPCHAYSYVLSLKYRQWFKVPFFIMQDEPASVLAKTPTYDNTAYNYLDLSAESSTTHVTFHMQSRPFSMGYQYIHMHRLVSQMRAKLTTGDLVVVGLYGSDDLQEWNLLAYSKRAGASTPLKVSQIRTTSAARSWRYYTICIGGTVYAGAEDNTDIGPFLVDYEPVVRRIG